MPRTVRRTAFLLVLVALSVSAGREAARGDTTNNEVRALWVQRGTLTSAPAIISLIDTATAAGFNTLLVQARGRGDAYYVSRLEPRGAALASQDPSFDPLELAVTAGHHAACGCTPGST